MKRQKQIIRVLDAVDAGATTSAEIEAVTDLPLKTVSAWLSVLTEEGLVKRTGKVRFHETGRPSFSYRSI